jgi:hypothetical protein
MTPPAHEARFARHVHEVVDLDEHGASLGALEESIDSMNLGVEEQAALRVLVSSLHTGANVNQPVTGIVPATSRVDPEMQTRLSTERWINEGGSLGSAARAPAHAAEPGTLGDGAGTSKWSWHDDQPEILP